MNDYNSDTSNLSRRMLLRRIALAGTALATSSTLGACRKEEVKPLREISFYATGTLDIETEWARLADQRQIKLRFIDNGNDPGPVIGQMVTGTAAKDYDIGGLQGGAERELAEAGVIEPWDIKRISAWPRMWDLAASEIPYIRHKNATYGIPIAVNADSMIYLPERIKAVAGYESGRIDSYFALFDERLRGRASMEDAWVNSAIFTAIYLKETGHTIADPGNLTESELREVMGFLIEKKRSGQFKKFWRGWEQGVELLSNGDVWVMSGWEPIVYELRRRGIQAEYAIPKEGYEGWSNDLILHSGATTRGRFGTAHEMVDWMLSGEYGAILALKRGYAVPNDLTTEFALTHPEHNDGRVQAICDNVQKKFVSGKGRAYWQRVRPDNHRLYDEWWSRVRSA